MPVLPGNFDQQIAGFHGISLPPRVKQGEFGLRQLARSQNYSCAHLLDAKHAYCSSFHH